MTGAGWTLLYHKQFLDQLQALVQASVRAKQSDPAGYRKNANVKLLETILRQVRNVIPADPTRPEYRQGKTLGPEYRHWFRAKFFQRFRLFFRYDTRTRVILYAWVNDEQSLRARDSRSDAYEVFRRMLESGNPPDELDTLLSQSRALPQELLQTIQSLLPD